MIVRFNTATQSPVAGKSNTGMYLFLAAVATLGIWYFGFHLPKKKKEELAAANKN